MQLFLVDTTANSLFQCSVFATLSKAFNDESWKQHYDPSRPIHSG
jgi:hypothetical protein